MFLNAYFFSLSAEAAECNHLFAGPLVINVSSHCFNYARNLVAHHTGLGGPVGILSLPGQNVGKVESRSLDADGQLVSFWCRIRCLMHLQHLIASVGGIYDLTHGFLIAIWKTVMGQIWFRFSGCRVPDASYRMQDTGFWLVDTGGEIGRMADYL